MRDTPLDDSLGGPDVETETVAGVAVPTTCRDRIDDETLAGAVAVLDEYSVTDYTVSPVGGLQIQVGIHRPDTVQDALYESLSRVGGGVTDHGTTNGFRRLRVDVTTAAGSEDTEADTDGDGATGDSRDHE
jgi:hypothetical protein